MTILKLLDVYNANSTEIINLFEPDFLNGLVQVIYLAGTSEGFFGARWIDLQKKSKPCIGFIMETPMK